MKDKVSLKIDDQKVGLLDLSSKKEVKKEKPKKEPTQKVSIFQLFRYTSWSDRILLIVGSLVACVTGVGFPLMSIVMGDISQNFIDVQKVTNATEIPSFFKDLFAEYVIKNCWKYVYIGTATFVCASIQALCFLIVCENLVHKLRQNFFEALLRQDIPWFDNNSSGTMTSKLFDALERVKEGTGDKLGLMIQFVAQFFGGFFVAFYYDWRLTLIMMSLSPLLIVSGAFMARLMASAATIEAKKYAVAGGIAEEVLTSIRTVIAFNGQGYECDRYENALKDGRKTGLKKAVYIGTGLAVTFGIMFCSYGLAFYVGTNFVADGSMQAGTVLTVFFSVMIGSMALGSAGPQFAVIGTAMGSAAGLYEVIDRTPDIDSYSEEGVKPDDIKGEITVEDVHFSYPSRPDVQVLKGVSLSAKPGQTIALVGASGSGKSTIVQLLLRYYNAKSGKITIDGIALQDLNIRSLRKFIGVVSQEPNLFNTTIEQNIRYGRKDVTDDEIKEALKQANAFDFVNSFPKGIHTLVGDRGTQMSGGQKQRIAIARTLVRNPRILLLDEATSALDAESESVVQQALENASKGRTTIVVAHRLSTVQNADQIIAIKEGQVQEIGTHQELLAKKGLYFDLVNSQVFVDHDSSSSEQVEASSPVKSGPTDFSQFERSKSITSYDEEKKEKEKMKDDLERLKIELEEEGVRRIHLLQILKYARPEWKFLAVGMTMAIVQGAVFPVFSIFFTQIIETFSTTDIEELRSGGHFWASMFLVLAAVQAITMFTQCIFFGLSSESLTMRLRSAVFRNVLRMDGAYFDSPKHSSGKISTRLASDAPTVKSALDYRLGSVFNSFVSVFMGLTIAFYYGWQLAIFTTCIFPLQGVGEALKMKFFSGSFKKDTENLENSGKLALEAVENMRTVQSLTLEKRLYSRFCNLLEEPHNQNIKRAFLQGISYGFATSVFYFLYAATFRFGLFLIMQDVMLPFHVLRVLFAISFTAGSMGFASAYFPEYTKATYAAGLMFKMLDEDPKIDGMSTEGKKPKIDGSIKVNDVYFRYPERPSVPILQGLDLQVSCGQTLALVGASGCGKSTVISLLERLYDHLDGEITIDEVNIREINPTHLRSHISLVAQEPTLFDTSIRQNIVYGLENWNQGDVERVSKMANIHQFVSGLPEGYETRVGDKGTQLSGGQKQRIAIARALIRDPQILLLDEATSALDTESEKVVQAALDLASQGRTCIIVAHRLSTVVNADCIAVVKDGKVVEKGTHQELMSNRSFYWNLTQKQSVRAN